MKDPFALHCRHADDQALAPYEGSTLATLKALRAAAEAKKAAAIARCVWARLARLLYGAAPAALAAKPCHDLGRGPIHSAEVIHLKEEVAMLKLEQDKEKKDQLRQTEEQQRQTEEHLRQTVEQLRQKEEDEATKVAKSNAAAADAAAAQEKEEATSAADKLAAAAPPSISAAARKRWVTAAWVLAGFTAVYNVGEGCVSIALGLEDESVALFGFGLDSLVSASSDAYHYRPGVASPRTPIFWRLKEFCGAGCRSRCFPPPSSSGDSAPTILRPTAGRQHWRRRRGRCGCGRNAGRRSWSRRCCWRWPWSRLCGPYSH